MRPDLPGSIQVVLDRALAKDRDQRYPRAADLSTTCAPWWMLHRPLAARSPPLRMLPRSILNPCLALSRPRSVTRLSRHWTLAYQLPVENDCRKPRLRLLLQVFLLSPRLCEEAYQPCLACDHLGEFLAADLILRRDPLLCFPPGKNPVCRPHNPGYT